MNILYIYIYVYIYIHISMAFYGYDISIAPWRWPFWTQRSRYNIEHPRMNPRWIHGRKSPQRQRHLLHEAEPKEQVDPSVGMHCPRPSYWRKEFFKQFCGLHTRKMDGWRLHLCTLQWGWQHNYNALNIFLTTARRLYPHCHQKASHIDRYIRLTDW